MTPFEARQKLHEARQIIHAVAQAVGGADVTWAEFDTSKAIDVLVEKIDATVSIFVCACNLRVGDVVAIGSGNVPDMTVAVAEYAPQNGCIAFRIGFESENGGAPYFMHTQGWRDNGIYSWSKGFYAAPESAKEIIARVDLFHERYPEEAMA